MERLSETFLRYVRAKVEAGADAIQLFDSWVGALTVEDYEEFVAPYSERILGGLSVPTIHFGTGTSHLLESMAAAGGDVIGLDWRIPLGEGWERGRIGPRRPGQPRSGAAPGLVGPCGACDRRHPRGGRRAAGSHLQPRPRRPPEHGPGHPPLRELCAGLAVVTRNAALTEPSRGRARRVRRA